MTTHSLSPNGTHDSEKHFRAEEVERTSAAARPGFGTRVKRHCARRWWLHLIIFCVIFLIVALCLVYVAMPKIAQHGVDESHLELTELKFLEPTSNSVVLTQKVILHSPSIFTPTLDPFNADSWLVTNGVFGAVPMLVIPMPKIHALHPQSNASVENINVTISSLDETTAFATAVVANEYVTTALTGKTTLHEGALPTTNINYNTTTKYLGLNGLKGFNVTDVKINLTAAAGEPNLRGNAFIPNPSVMTIAMGNVTMTLSTAKSGIVGNSTINDFTLVPGNNSLPMSGIVNQTLITQSLNDQGIVTLLITGQSAIYNGQHLTYYEKALAQNVLSLDMNVLRILTGGS